MKVLIIDDSDYKIRSLHQLISSWRSVAEVKTSRSFQSGLKALKEWKPELVLLDMTLPTSEDTTGQLEGRIRVFGGRELLAEMDFEGLRANVIVVTQFDSFGDPVSAVDKETLFKQLKNKFPESYRGGIYYSNVDSKWRTSLLNLLNSLGT